MAGDARTTVVEGHRLRLTNLDKVLYPATGMTKADVIAYLLAVAPVLLPHVRDRALTRKRWVEGVGTDGRPGPVFFQKQAEPSAPSWIPRRTLRHRDHAARYLLVQDAATLVWLAQTDTLELHVPQWRFGPRGVHRRPDRLVLDLDPGEGAALAECAGVAVAARALLAERGLTASPVTSGSKGIHLYAALDGRRSSDEVAAMAREVARELEAGHPDLVVSSMRKELRRGKVLVDWSQNNAAKTTVAPYSLRGRLRPTVAAPRTWREIADPQLAQLEWGEVVERVGRDGDLLAGLDDAAATVGAGGSGGADAGNPGGADVAEGARAPTRRRTARAPAAPGRVPELAPMLAVTGTVEQVDDAGRWAYEPKWDGVRALARVSGNRVALRGRNGTDLTPTFPELGALADAAEGDVTLDGEIVAVDEAGRPDFGRLQRRLGLTAAADVARTAESVPAHFIAFDLLAVDGTAVLERTTDERRRILDARVHPDAGGRVWVSPRLDGDLADALAVSRDLGLEGVVAKRRDAPYRPGRRSTAWVKLKHQRMQEVVVGGWRPGRGRRDGGVGSVLVGIPAAGGLHYVGRVGTGLDDRALARLAGLLAERERSDAPFTDVPAAEARTARWVRPDLVGEVIFSGWTAAGRLRQPSWRGLRSDRSADGIRVDDDRGPGADP
jgi:bifunctional non-homologous end joining protein LigD